jgi:hypothetical protein
VQGSGILDGGGGVLAAKAKILASEVPKPKPKHAGINPPESQKKYKKRSRQGAFFEWISRKKNHHQGGVGCRHLNLPGLGVCF